MKELLAYSLANECLCGAKVSHDYIHRGSCGVCIHYRELLSRGTGPGALETQLGFAAALGIKFCGANFSAAVYVLQAS